MISANFTFSKTVPFTRLFLLLSVNFTVSTSRPAKVTPLFEYVESIEGTEYFLDSAHSRNFEEAREFCSGQGDMLATFRSKEEQNWAFDVLANKSSFWIGARNEPSSNLYANWIDGSPLIYSDFGPDEPKQGRGDCTALYVHDQYGKWFTWPCLEWRFSPTVCKRGIISEKLKLLEERVIKKVKKKMKQIEEDNQAELDAKLEDLESKISSAMDEKMNKTMKMIEFKLEKKNNFAKLADLKLLKKSGSDFVKRKNLTLDQKQPINSVNRQEIDKKCSEIVEKESFKEKINYYELLIKILISIAALLTILLVIMMLFTRRLSTKLNVTSPPAVAQ